MTNSSKRTPPLTLAVRFTEKAAELLTEFANTRAEDFERFESRWDEKTGLGWYSGTGRERGGEPDPLKVQKVVRELWEGKHQGSEDQLIAQGLSLVVPRQEAGFVDTSQLLFHVQWDLGLIWANPRDLGDYVWLSLLQYSRRLGVCANKENGCPAPYFLRKKANQKFCSEVCAAPSQKAFKRQWFKEYGDQWRKKWLKKQKKSAKKSRGGK